MIAINGIRAESAVTWHERESRDLLVSARNGKEISPGMYAR